MHRGCGIRKRYEDIEEILDAGIDVYTTVNIQHLESLNDIVEKITGIHVKERIPDSVFDSATQVKLVDIEPDILIERLKEGKIYKAVQAERALNNFFAKEKLIALREIALRRMADKVNRVAIQGAFDAAEQRRTGVLSGRAYSDLYFSVTYLCKSHKERIETRICLSCTVYCLVRGDSVFAECR